MAALARVSMAQAQARGGSASRRAGGACRAAAALAGPSRQLAPRPVRLQAGRSGAAAGRAARICVRADAGTRPMANALAVPEEPSRVGQNKQVKELLPKRARVLLSLAGWFFLNAVFAIYNKKTLNVFPYPWLLSWIQIAVGALMMIVAWGTKLLPAPEKFDMKTCIKLVPTAMLHLIAHVSACACYNFSNVSFMQMVKSAEPACSVICLTLFYQKRFSPLVWLTLVPIIGGVALGSSSEINFSMLAFVMAMLSNVACAFRGVTSKEAQEELGLRGINLYAAIAIVSSVLLLPMALVVEGQHLATAFAAAGPKMVELGYGATAAAFIPFLLTGSAFYHLYNQTSYQALGDMSPLTHSVANTVKRVIIICASLVIFQNPITPLGAVSAAVAIGGTFLYSLARQHEERVKKAEAAAPAAA